jgi:colicin import membrane protein
MTEKQLTVQDMIATALKQYDYNEAMIAELSQRYMILTIKGLDDAEGYKAVHEARMLMVKARTTVEKTRKILNEDAIDYKKKVDARAKELTGLMAPIEEHLTAQENIVTAEKQRIKEKADREAAEKLQARVNRLQFDLGMKFDGQHYRLSSDPAGYAVPHALISALKDEDFEKICAEIYGKIQAENARLAAIEAQKQKEEAEKERLRKVEDERLAKVAKEQAEAQAKIDAENKRIADEKIKIKAAEEAQEKFLALERAALEAEKKALQEKKDAEAREKIREQELKDAQEMAAARALAQKAADEEAARIEKERLEAEIKAKTERELALRPDRQKILEFVTMLETLILPEMKTEEGLLIRKEIADDIGRLAKRVRKQVREL